MNAKLNKPILAVLTAALILSVGLMAFLPTGSVAAAFDAGRGGPGGPQNGSTAPGGYPANGSGTPSAAPGGWQNNGTGSGFAAAGVALTPLSEAEKAALQDAILEEYGALNLYTAVIAQFGEQIPFTRIALSEQQHVNALVRQADKYGVEVPANPGLSAPLSFASLQEACAAGVNAEIADAALYDDLKLVTTHTDLLNVYNRLQRASLEMHLPAFQACD